MPEQDQGQKKQEGEHVVVIGAGITSLTSALFLAQANYLVTVIAAHLPGDCSIEYASPWAGAHWLPHSRANEPRICGWDVETYEWWKGMSEREREEMGVKQIPSYEFWDAPSPSYDIWYAPHVEAFRQLSTEKGVIAEINARTAETEKKAPKIQSGIHYKAASINVPLYLSSLQEKCLALSVRFIKARLPTVSFSAALAHAETLAQTETHRPKPSTFINASGLGASTLVPDDSMFPIRGQTVLVKGEAHSTITRVGQSLNGVVPDRTYAIPRPGSGTTILGGTKEEGVWDEHPDDVVTEGILKRARALVPELLTGEDEGFEVLSVQVGLRPGRRGGVRVEREVVSVGERKVRVVHAYGHAGSGYQNSVGGAREVCRLVQEGEGERVAKL